MTAFILGTLVASPVVLSSACGGMGDSLFGSSSKANLQTRVEEYWQARIQGNTQRTFQYEHPAQRDKLNEQTYRARTSRIDIRTFAIADPDSLQLPAEAQEASVPLRIQYQYVFPIPGVKPMLVPTTIHDRWKKQHGVWYHDLAARGVAGSKKTH